MKSNVNIWVFVLIQFMEICISDPASCAKNTDLRIMSDLKKIQSEKLDFISAEYVDDDLYRWKAEIKGPENSPYEGGVFQLDIKMPKNYPIVPPAISFTTQVYHPNVGRSGNICLDYIKGGWRQENTMLTALLAIRTFLAEPNPDHPMDPIIAQQYKDNKSAFEASAKSWTEKHAMRGKTIKLQEQPVTVVF